jgi:hypothetical protein
MSAAQSDQEANPFIIQVGRGTTQVTFAIDGPSQIWLEDLRLGNRIRYKAIVSRETVEDLLELDPSMQRQMIPLLTGMTLERFAELGVKVEFFDFRGDEVLAIYDPAADRATPAETRSNAA